MALFTPSESPAVVVKEIDLTGGVPNVQSTTGAFVGKFRWGPVEERKLIANEQQLADTFGTPDSASSQDFLTAVQFLKYSSSLQVVRVEGHGTNAGVSLGGEANARAMEGRSMLSGDSNENLQDAWVKNRTHWETVKSALDSNNQSYVAKYPGLLGNSLRVSICAPDEAAFNAWSYKDQFDGPPLTSDFATKKGALYDEIHLVVVDRLGRFTGTPGSVLETFPYLSVGKNALTSYGTSNFVKDVVNEKSQYIWMVGPDSAWGWQRDSIGAPGGMGQIGLNTNVGAGPEFGDSTETAPSYQNAYNIYDPNVDSTNNISINRSFGSDLDSGGRFYLRHLDPNSLGGQGNAGSISTIDFDQGADSSPTLGNYLSGFDLFEDKDTVEIDFLIAPGASSRGGNRAIVNDLVATAQGLRKDCVVVTSPAAADVVDQLSVTDAVNNAVATASGYTASSYLVADSTWLKVYDKYNDTYVNIPASSTTAGIMAATDINRAAWFSPAGSRRGHYLGITSLSYTPNKSQRDTLYKNGINPIANIPGHGVILYGDKTKLGRPSAFDRINVRRLFLVLERAISRAAEQVLFEFNDEFTRAEFVNIIEPVLREVKGRRGITDFRVIADETNNTPEVVDRNEFIANIYIKPARSINYVTLNFVAVRTGVDFSEVVGTV